MTPERIESTCNRAGLALFGAFHPGAGDGAPEGCETLILLGPQEPGFWARITASPEWPGPDPVDNWSRRVIGGLADRLGATALFPFGGPPHHPFVSWALKSGRAWPSPVGLLVHERAGLMVSFRGALVFSERLTLPARPDAPPCANCAGKPCLTACPASALTEAGYDLAACHDFLDRKAGQDCMSAGCLVRRACPVSRKHGRLAAQSAHHMRAFHEGRA